MDNSGSLNRIEFHESKKGYIKEEVDEYIQILTKEYEKALEELRISEDRSRHLEEENDELRKRAVTNNSDGDTSSAEKEAIASMLIKAEIIANDIKANAQREAMEERDKLRNDVELLNKMKRELIGDLQRINIAVDEIVRSNIK